MQPVSHCGGMGSTPRQSKWDMWLTKLHWYRSSLQVLWYSCQYNSNMCYTNSFIHPSLVPSSSAKLLPLCAFMACYRVTFTFTLSLMLYNVLKNMLIKKNFSAYMIIPTGPCTWCLLPHQGFQYPEQQFR